jgi:hypothetical protein
MSNLGFDNIQEKGGYLRQAGVNMDATFVALTYVANENWEGFDIELSTADGKMFRERTFGANIEKVFPKAKYQDGRQIGTETKQEAFERVQAELSKKLYHLAACFVRKDVLKEKVKSVRDLKDLVEKVNKAMAEAGTDRKINFLTMWKNSDIKQRSNLILADRIQWCEPTTYGSNGEVMNAKINFTQYQIANNMKEKYPYNANESGQTSDAIIGGSQAVDDLPF